MLASVYVKPDSSKPGQTNMSDYFELLRITALGGHGEAKVELFMPHHASFLKIFFLLDDKRRDEDPTKGEMLRLYHHLVLNHNQVIDVLARDEKACERLLTFYISVRSDSANRRYNECFGFRYYEIMNELLKVGTEGFDLMEMLANHNNWRWCNSVFVMGQYHTHLRCVVALLDIWERMLRELPRMRLEAVTLVFGDDKERDANADLERLYSGAALKLVRLVCLSGLPRDGEAPGAVQDRGTHLVALCTTRAHDTLARVVSEAHPLARNDSERQRQVQANMTTQQANAARTAQRKRWSRYEVGVGTLQAACQALLDPDTQDPATFKRVWGTLRAVPAALIENVVAARTSETHAPLTISVEEDLVEISTEVLAQLYRCDRAPEKDGLVDENPGLFTGLALGAFAASLVGAAPLSARDAAEALLLEAVEETTTVQDADIDDTEAAALVLASAAGAEAGLVAGGREALWTGDVQFAAVGAAEAYSGDVYGVAGTMRENMVRALARWPDFSEAAMAACRLDAALLARLEATPEAMKRLTAVALALGTVAVTARRVRERFPLEDDPDSGDEDHDFARAIAAADAPAAALHFEEAALARLVDLHELCSSSHLSTYFFLPESVAEFANCLAWAFARGQGPPGRAMRGAVQHYGARAAAIWDEERQQAVCELVAEKLVVLLKYRQGDRAATDALSLDSWESVEAAADHILVAVDWIDALGAMELGWAPVRALLVDGLVGNGNGAEFLAAADDVRGALQGGEGMQED